MDAPGLHGRPRERPTALGGARGAGSGLTALCTPQFLLFPPLFAGWIVWLQRASGREAWLRAGVFAVCAACPIAPWTLRNHRVFDRFIPVSTGALGYNLFLGTFESNTNWTGWNRFPPEIFEDGAATERAFAERNRFLRAYGRGTIDVSEPDAYFFRLAMERFAEAPLYALALGVQRIPRLWYQLYIPMYADREPSGAYFVFYFVFAALALLAAERRQRVRMSPVVLLFAYLTLIHLPLHIEPRFGFPAIPALLSLTGIGLFTALAAIARRVQSQPDEFA